VGLRRITKGFWRCNRLELEIARAYRPITCRATANLSDEYHEWHFMSGDKL
jgi:hypothetical protein